MRRLFRPSSPNFPSIRVPHLHFVRLPISFPHPQKLIKFRHSTLLLELMPGPWLLEKNESKEAERRRKDSENTFSFSFYFSLFGVSISFFHPPPSCPFLIFFFFCPPPGVKYSFPACDALRTLAVIVYWMYMLPF